MSENAFDELTKLTKMQKRREEMSVPSPVSFEDEQTTEEVKIDSFDPSEEEQKTTNNLIHLAQKIEEEQRMKRLKNKIRVNKTFQFDANNWEAFYEYARTQSRGFQNRFFNDVVRMFVEQLKKNQN